MDSPVAQFIEHSKLNREVPGSFPAEELIFSFQHQTVRDIYFSIKIMFKQSRVTLFIEDKTQI